MPGKVQRGHALDEFLNREGVDPLNVPDQDPRRYLFNQDRIIRLEELLKHFSRDPETGQIIIHIDIIHGYEPDGNTDGATAAELEELTGGGETALHSHAFQDHNLLSAGHPDTSAATPPGVGSVVRGSAGNLWEELVANATGTNKFLRSVSGGVPTWEALVAGDIAAHASTHAIDASDHLEALDVAVNKLHIDGNARTDILLKVSGGNLLIRTGDDWGPAAFLAASGAYSSYVQTAQLRLDVGSTLTINAGAIAVTGSQHMVDTEGGAASDDLTNITGFVTGQVLILRPLLDTRSIVIKHDAGGGNISCVGQQDITLDEVEDFAVLIYSAVYSKWFAFGRYADAEAIAAVEAEATLVLTGDVSVAAAKTLELLTDGVGGGLKFGAGSDVHLYRGAADDLYLGVGDSLTITNGDLFVGGNIVVTGTVDGVDINDLDNNAVKKQLFDAHTMLYATADDTPLALEIAASRIVGRKAAGDISAMTGAEVLAILSAQAGAAFDWSGQNLTNIGSIAPTSIDCGGIITAASYIAIEDQNELRFYEGANYVGFEAPALAADQIWVLPAADGANTQVLSTDGAGNLSWQDMAAAGAHKDTHDPNDGADPLDTAAPNDIFPDDVNAEGTAHSLALSDHTHGIDCAVPLEIAQVQAGAEGGDYNFARAEHVHAISHGVTDNHLVTVDDAGGGVADEYAQWTASGLRSRSTSEVAGDLKTDLKGMLYSVHQYVFTPDAAPETAIVADASDPQGTLHQSGPSAETVKLITSHAETAPVTTAATWKIQYKADGDLDLGGGWTDIDTTFTHTAGAKTVATASFDTATIPADATIRFLVTAAGGTPAEDVSVIMEVWRPLQT